MAHASGGAVHESVQSVRASALPLGYADQQHRKEGPDASTARAPRYSDKYPFRMRSETPEIAIELSLQVCLANRA